MTKPSRGELWFVNLAPTIGHEQSNKRPCLILSNDMFNGGRADLFIVLPLTSRDKKNPLHIPVNPSEGGLTEKSFILVEQIRAISSKRLLGSSIGKISEKTLQMVEETLKTLLDFE